jgi:replication factor C subunit 2/4
MNKLWQVMSGNLFDALHNTVTSMMYEGYPLSSILSQLHDELISKPNLSDLDKALICEKIAEVSKLL